MVTYLHMIMMYCSIAQHLSLVLMLVIHMRFQTSKRTVFKCIQEI